MPIKQKKINTSEDIAKIDDSELIQGARKIELISELGFKHLDFIRYMRNWASAAHPNQNQLTGLQLVSWFETCVKEVISLPLSNVATGVRKLLSNVKKSEIDKGEAKKIAVFFIDLNSQQVDNIVSGFFGIYVDIDTTPQVKQNIRFLLPHLWHYLNEQSRKRFGLRYAKYLADGEVDNANKFRELLEVVNGINYITDELKIVEMIDCIKQLLVAHRNTSNFYTEPVFARQLERWIGETGNVPSQIRKEYVLGLVEVFITNGHGVAWGAEPFYINLIDKFSQEEAIIAMTSFTEEVISSRLQFHLCREKYKQLISMIRGKFSAPSALEVLEAIEKYTGPLDNMKIDSIIVRKTNSMKSIIG